MSEEEEYQKFLEWTEKQEEKGKDWKGKLKRDSDKASFMAATGAYEKITKIHCPVCTFQQLWRVIPPVPNLPPEGGVVSGQADYNTLCRYCGTKMTLNLVEPLAPYIDNVLMSWTMAFEDEKGDFETMEATGFVDAARQFLERKGLDPKELDPRKGRYEGRRIVALSSSKL